MDNNDPTLAMIFHTKPTLIKAIGTLITYDAMDLFNALGLDDPNKNHLLLGEEDGDNRPGNRRAKIRRKFAPVARNSSV